MLPNFQILLGNYRIRNFPKVQTNDHDDFADTGVHFTSGLLPIKTPECIWKNNVPRQHIITRHCGRRETLPGGRPAADDFIILIEFYQEIVIRKNSPTPTSSASFLIPLLLCAAMDADVVFYRTQNITTRASQESTPRKPLSSLPCHCYNFERRKEWAQVVLRASVERARKELHKAFCDRERNSTQSHKKKSRTHTPKKNHCKVQKQSAEFFSLKRELKENSHLLRLKLATEFWKNKFRDFVFSRPGFPGSLFLYNRQGARVLLCNFF